MTTWNTQKTRLRMQLEETTAGVWDDANLRYHFNNGMRDVAKKADPTEMLKEYDFNSAVGTRKYTLPTDFRRIRRLYRGNTAMWREKTEDWSGVDVSATGTPVAYTTIGASIALRPVPSVAASMHLKYQAWPSDITATGDTIPLPDDYLDALDQYVLAKAYEQTGERDMRDMHWENYARALMDLKSQQTAENVADGTSNPREVW